MALIDIKKLTFEYVGGLEPIFKELTLQLDTGWKLGFILVSHDREFINNIVSHILTIEKNGIVL